MKKLSLELDAVIDSLHLMASFLEDACARWHVPDEMKNRMDLAADECVTNVILYAYGDEPGNISLSLEKHGDLITLSITDTGVPFDPTRHADPDTSVPIEKRQIGGLGIFLTRKMVDAIRYERVNDTNTLTLTLGPRHEKT